MITRTVVLLSMAFVAGCSGPARVPQTVIAAPAKVFLRDNSAPGFDKRDFPGVEPMRVWMRESPYVWVGYYLPSPCYAGVAWTGQRAALIEQGWGLAVIYVGQQAGSPSASSTVASAAAAAAPNCRRMPLTAAQGQLDGDEAANAVAADGFAPGTTIFLDIERSDPLPATLIEYARGWMARVLERGFVPGVYAHKLNAQALWEAQRAVFAAAASTVTPPFWVSNSVGFDLGLPPSQSGYAFATMWQNPSDANETYGGVTFRIDRNVATTRNPSRP